MIYDRLGQLASYRGLSANLDRAVDYLLANDLTGLPEGSSEIDGDRVFLRIMGYETKDAALARFEAHRRYIDIQLVLEGRELVFVRPLEGLDPEGGFDADKDFGLYKGGGGASLPLEPGVFGIFFPQDAHMPCCDLNGRTWVRKAVLKVAARAGF